MKRILCALLLASNGQAFGKELSLHDAPKPYVGSRQIEVDGRRYRVEIKSSGEVVVVSKAFVTVRTVLTQDDMFRAVIEATGCELIQPMWRATALHGKLRCEAPSAKADVDG